MTANLFSQSVTQDAPLRKLTQAAALAVALLAPAVLGGAQAATAITTSPANLRRVPSAHGLVLRVVPRGTLLTVACSSTRAGEWCRTSVDGRGGYVAASLLRPLTRSAPLSGVFYATCTQMRAAGAAPIRVGQPGYRAALDHDHDGWACRFDHQR